MLMLLVAVIGITFAACSNDDEPQSDAVKEQNSNARQSWR